MEKKATLLHCWWGSKLVKPLWTTVWKFIKKLKTELSFFCFFFYSLSHVWLFYDPMDCSPPDSSVHMITAIPLLGIYVEKTLIPKVTCSPMFIAALFIIAKTCKQPKCPLIGERIENTHTHTQSILPLSHNKEWNNAICSNLDGPRDFHS